MKKFALILIPVALVAADPQNKPAAAKEKPKSITVPSDAKLVGKGVWTYTDPGGKKWLYRQTPFGLSKVEDRTVGTAAAAEAAPAKPAVEVTAVEKDGVVRFEKPGPFGTRVWTKAAGDLTSEEKEILARSKAKGENQ